MNALIPSPSPGFLRAVEEMVRGKDLTPREHEVFVALCWSQDIAVDVGIRLGIAEETMRIHMKRIYVKLDASHHPRPRLALSGKLLQAAGRPAFERAIQAIGVSKLSPRQRDVVERLCWTFDSSEDIGFHVGMDATAVSTHLQRAYKKLGLGACPTPRPRLCRSVLHRVWKDHP